MTKQDIHAPKCGLQLAHCTKPECQAHPQKLKIDRQYLNQLGSDFIGERLSEPYAEGEELCFEIEEIDEATSPNQTRIVLVLKLA